MKRLKSIFLANLSSLKSKFCATQGQFNAKAIFLTSLELIHFGLKHFFYQKGTLKNGKFYKQKARFKL
jgi:hypothetical protein